MARLALTVAAVGVAAFALFGCGQESPSSVPAADLRPPAKAAEPAVKTGTLPPPELQSVKGADPMTLKPLPSGPGLLVAEPSGSDPLRSFGAGCARWLHLAVGGEGEAGKTPLWISVRHVAHETRKGHLRLQKADIPTAARCLGVTHVAIGTLSGSPGSATISYQLHRADTGRAVGPRITASGSREQIVAALPRVAKQLARGIGIRAPGIPAKVTESSKMLSALGEIAWHAPPDLPGDQTEILSELSLRSPLGALLFLINREACGDGNMYSEAVDSTRRLAPNNLLLLSQIALNCLGSGGQDIQALKPQIETLQKRHPNNYLTNVAFASLSLSEGDFPTGRKRLERAVSCSMGNPSSWLTLGRVIWNQSDAIRQGNTVDKVSEGHMQVCQALYELAVKACREATKRDPQHPTAWNELSNAADFLGDEQAAVLAFERQLQLEKSNPLPDASAMFEWGLQLYHPKWYENPEKARKLAMRAVAESRKAGDAWPETYRQDVALRVACLGYGDLAGKIVRTGESRSTLAQMIEMHSQELVDPDVRVSAAR